MECKFEAGQKVVCIDDDWTYWVLPEIVVTLPVKGNVYTIKEVGPACLVGGVGVRLFESNPVIWYSYLCFAPVQDNRQEQRSTQKEVDRLKELLIPTKVDCPRKLEEV